TENSDKMNEATLPEDSIKDLMTMKGRKFVVMTEDGHEDLELWVPYYRLIEAGAEVVLAGHEKRIYSSKHSYPCEVDMKAADLKSKDFDAVVIPGGVAGPDRMRQHKEILADRKSTRLNSSHQIISYAVFCLKKKKN